MNLFEGRFVVHAVDERQRFFFKHFGRGDVGQDHEFFDQLVGVQSLWNDDAIHGAVRLEQNLAFGNVEIERIAFFARALHHRVGVVKRSQDGGEQGTGYIVRPAIDRRLRLRIMQFGGRAHQDAVKAVRAFATIVADHHPDGERTARLTRYKGAEIVGDAFRQHRHHAIRKVD